MNSFMSCIEDAGTIAIAGHMRPDGDCVGSCMGLYGYITDNYPEKKVTVLIRDIPQAFDFLKKEDAFQEKCAPDGRYELFVALDCGDRERLGERTARIMDGAGKVCCVDHHITNTRFGDLNFVEDSSSTSQILYSLMDQDKISLETASALYTGIVHDTGVFRHSCTNSETMRIAGELMNKGVPFGKIIDESFYMKTYKQLQLMGRCLTESVRILGGRCIFSIVKRSVLDLYGAVSGDLEGVIDQMRTAEGIEVALLLTEWNPGEYKVSMRSNTIVDVSKIAKFYGGGGHIKAAGFTAAGQPFDIINNMTPMIEDQM